MARLLSNTQKKRLSRPTRRGSARDRVLRQHRGALLDELQEEDSFAASAAATAAACAPR